MQIMTSLRIIRGRGLLIATIIIHICILQLHYITEKAVWVGLSGGTNSNNTTNIYGDQTSTSSTTFEYIPAPVENLIVTSAETLGYTSQNNPSGCDIWKANTTHNEIYDSLSSYAKDLAEYNKAVANFQPIPDVFKSIKKGDYSVCDATRIHKDGVRGLFPSNQLSLTKNGYIEPLAPPFRSNVFCTDKRHLLSLDYLVHDFEQMCRNLKPTSRRVLIDMGAALNFHGGGGVMLRLLQQYEKFGFHFDHYYAFEVAFTEPKKVYEELLRKEYLPIYHWINTGEREEHWCVLILMHDHTVITHTKVCFKQGYRMRRAVN